MINQIAIKFEESTSSDIDFLLNINKCLTLCSYYVEHGQSKPHYFSDIKGVGLYWLSQLRKNAYHSLAEAQYLEDQFNDLNCQFLKVHGLNDEVKQVSQPAAPKKLQVFRVLGQVAKATFPKLSISWTLTQSQAKKLFSNTRPVGGLA